MIGLLDSGAFSDPPEQRLTPELALQRQLTWEQKAQYWWRYPWQAEALVSYDLLIDEKWTAGVRRKERWSVRSAERAVAITIAAAQYLVSQRQRLQPRQLVLACQGVDHDQYAECLAGVLEVAQPEDWIGLGGWCILGRWRSWIPQFWATCWRVLPRIAAAGLRRVHIFGVMYLPVLGGLLYLCDQWGLALSTDSSGPVLQTTWKDFVKSGAYRETWEENVRHCQHLLATLRQSRHYREPPQPQLSRQLQLWDDTL